MARHLKKSIAETLRSSATDDSLLHRNDNNDIPLALAVLDRKIVLATEGFTNDRFCKMVLKDRGRLSEENALTICDYIIAMKREINPRLSYKRYTIQFLSELSRAAGIEKKFIDMTLDDILCYLDKGRKTEDKDPMHKWIGSYNTKLVILCRFFKWLYYPDVGDPKRRNELSALERKPEHSGPQRVISRSVDYYSRYWILVLYMKALIFDMDGVLVDAMPFHYEAMKTAVKEITNIDLDKRTFYLLEGMPVEEMALEIFKLKGYHVDDGSKKNISEEEPIIQTSEEVAKRKKEIFTEMNIIPKPYNGVRELISNDLRGCMKAVVSGAAKQEVDTIIEQNFGKDNFDLIMNGDELEGKGKPDPAPFKVAIQRLDLDNNEALVVENAPLGIKSANDAGIPSIVTLNTSPLAIDDFKELISEDRIFKDTISARRYLKKSCIIGDES